MTSTLETTSGPKKSLPEGPLVPNIPARSSSNPNKQPSSASPISGTISGDQAQVSEVEPKGVINLGVRSGSVASSKRLRKGQRTTPSTPNDILAPSAEKPRKRGVSKFLSFLNCCSAPEDANTVETDNQAIPTKKAKGFQSIRNRQATPAVKPSADSSTGESKEPADENIGGPPYSELTPAAKPTMLSPRSGKETVHTEKSPSTESSGQALDENEEATHPEPRNQPLPPLPVSSKPASHDELSEKIQPVLPSTISKAEPPEPSKSLPSDQNVVVQDMASNDRPPKEEKIDGDVPMVDAPPIVHIPEQQAKNPEPKDDSQPHVNLPPPPPRNNQDRAATGLGRSPSSAATPNEKQQWLLPPLQPRFKGKKCLVLDLDETLVHSSFKVRSIGVIKSLWSDVDRPFIKRILPYLSRLRVSIIMYMLSKGQAWINL